jgi:class 3 adenylate cyclase
MRRRSRTGRRAPGRHARPAASLIAKRVEAVAPPSAILVTRTVVDLVAGSGIEFAYHGIHELKGVPDDWHLYEVTYRTTRCVGRQDRIS